jgi:2-keto-4-pentenoate hydratase/2-oxohepta-3-ene-1,7-dioic acid hydratase in catechol pathway
MLFSPSEIVANISTWHTLQPGDLIQCGTASGVGLLKPGDVCEISFEGIGVLCNWAVTGEGMQALDLVWIEYRGD